MQDKNKIFEYLFLQINLSFALNSIDNTWWKEKKRLSRNKCQLNNKMLHKLKKKLKLEDNIYYAPFSIN